jgi:hypothetical protein
MTPKTKIVIEVTEVSVEAPLRDGARAWIHELGFFSSARGSSRRPTRPMTTASGTRT